MHRTPSHFAGGQLEKSSSKHSNGASGQTWRKTLTVAAAASASTCSCFEYLPGGNLKLDGSPSIAQRCKMRFQTLPRAMHACVVAKHACGGITMDGGINCERGQGARREERLLQYELRTKDLMPPSPCVKAQSCEIQSWTIRDRECCSAYEAPPKETPFQPSNFGRAKALERSLGAAPAGSAASKMWACLQQLPTAGKQPAAKPGRLRQPAPTDDPRLLRGASEAVRCFIESGHPFLVGRPSLGSELEAAYFGAYEGRAPTYGCRKVLSNNAGVVTNDDAALSFEYALRYFEALNASDVLVRWDHARYAEPYARPSEHYLRMDHLLELSGHLALPSGPHFVVDHQVRTFPRRTSEPHLILILLLASFPSSSIRFWSRGCCGNMSAPRGCPLSSTRLSSSSPSSTPRLPSR